MSDIILFYTNFCQIDWVIRYYALFASQPFGPILPRPCQKWPRGGHPDSHCKEIPGFLPYGAHASVSRRPVSRRSTHSTNYLSVCLIRQLTNPDRSRHNSRRTHHQRSGVFPRSRPLTGEIRLPDQDPHRVRNRMDPTHLAHPGRGLPVSIPIRVLRGIHPPHAHGADRL